MSIVELFRSHPMGVDDGPLPHAVAEAITCAIICTGCADACLSEEEPAKLARCIRLDLDCADICTAMAAQAMREPRTSSERFISLLQLCAESCDACAAECALHQDMHDHCAICARACRKCAQACRDAIAGLQGAAPRSQAYDTPAVTL